MSTEDNMPNANEINTSNERPAPTAQVNVTSGEYSPTPQSQENVPLGQYSPIPPVPGNIPQGQYSQMPGTISASKENRRFDHSGCSGNTG